MKTAPRRRPHVTVTATTALLLLATPLQPAPAGVVTPAPRRPAAPLGEFDQQRLRHLTLDDAIDLAVRRNPNVLTALQNIQNSKGAYITARAGALPQLTGSGTYSQTDKGLNESFSSSSSSTTADPNAPNGNLFAGSVQPGNQVVNSDGTPFNFNSAVSTALLGGSATGTGNNTGTGALSSLLGGSGSNSGTQNKSYQIQLQVTQNIYTGGRVSAQVRAAQLTEGNAYYNLREVIDTTILNVRTGFYNVLLGRELIRVQEESIRLLQNQLQDQRNRFAAGTVPQFNVLQAETQLGNQTPQADQARNNFALQKLQLARLIGIDSDPTNGRIADFDLVGELAYEPRTFNADRAIKAALANRSILKQRRQEVQIQQEQIRVALSTYYPQVQADVGVQQRSSQVETLGDPVNGWFLGATATWNIFDGLSGYGQYKQARANRNSAMVTFDDAVRQIKLDVQNAILSLQLSKDTVNSQTKNVSTAAESVRLAQARLSAGAGVQLDVLNAQTQLTTAESNLAQAKYNYNVALATLDQATGTSTVYQDNLTDPISRRGLAPVPISDRGTPRTVTRGETTSNLKANQTAQRRAQGTPEKPKIDAEEAGRARPKLAHPVDPNAKRQILSALPTETFNP